MTTEHRRPVCVEALLMAVLALAAGVALGTGNAWAAPANNVWLGDGATGSLGAWTLPMQGTCQPDPSKMTRPECMTLRLPASTSTQCTNLGGTFATSRICNDLAQTDQASCQGAGSNRVWNPGICALLAGTSGTCAGLGGTWVDSSYCNLPTFTDSGSCGSHNATWTSAGRCVVPAATDSTSCATVTGSTWFRGACAVDLSDVDRVEPICEQQLDGTYPTAGVCVGNWVMPPRLAYNPPMQTGTGNGNSGVGGDLCLRCHNTTTEYNSYPARWVNSYLDTLHKPEGVVCGRCHGSGIDTTTCNTSESPGHLTQCSVTTGLNLHNSGMTSPDAGTGYCTQPLWVDITSCTANGGLWLTACSKAGACSLVSSTDSLSCQTAGSCSNVSYTNFFDCWNNGATWNPTNTWTAYSTQATCLAASGTWNVSTCTVGGGTCNYADASTCTTAGGMWLTNGNACFFPGPTTTAAAAAAACAAASKTWTDTWTDFDTCQDAGACATASTPNPPTTASLSAACTNAGGGYSSGTCTGSGNLASAAAIVCTGAGGTWDSTNKLCNNVTQTACLEGGGTWTVGVWTGTKKQYGPSITGLCMQCHRQETAGVPNDNPGTVLKVGRQDSTVEFLHPAANDLAAVGNQFLNSPHGYFTGTFAQIGSAAFGTGYSSFFQVDDQEVKGVGAGCTGCHNPHMSVVNGAADAFKPCQECHAGQFGVDLTKINHLATKGTPLDPGTVGTGEAAPCVTCHMPKGVHMFRINPDATYSTFPASVFSSGAPANADTEADSQSTSAVWVDLDAACGQCHGGGSVHATTTGSIGNGNHLLTVADASGFAPGVRIKISGAGASGADLETYVGSASGTAITLVGDAATTVTSQVVEVNPTANGAPYLTKATLAGAAEGMHSNAGVPANITFSASTNGLTVSVNALVTCGLSACPSLAYTWNWGDNLSDGTVDPVHADSHTYSGGGKYSITLTVKLNSTNSNNTTVGSVTRSVTVTAPDLPPVAGIVGNACTWNANTWTMTLQDASTDTDSSPVQTVYVDWGDSTRSFGGQGTAFSHTYFQPGYYAVTLTAIDSALQMGTPVTCPTPATPAFFTISGTVFQSDTTTQVPSAAVTVKRGSILVKTVYTGGNGMFTASSLKPGTYTLTVAKSGYEFAAPAATIIAGPSSTGNNINAITP
jgi:hypothetical protein